MYKSRYLPVKVLSATEASVHTEEQVYPINLLQDAHDYLTGKQNSNVIMNNGNVTFMSNPEIRWFLVDIVNAYEYFQVAKENKFAFYPIYDTKGVIALYTSNIFKNARILVDAFTMNTVLVTKVTLIKKLSQMIDQKHDVSYLLDLFNMAVAVDNGKKNNLDAWLCQLDVNEFYMALNPLTTLYPANTVYYGFDELEDMEKLLMTGKPTGVYTFENNLVTRNDLNYWQPMSAEWCKNLVSTWHRLQEKNKIYLQLDDPDTMLSTCYVSKDLYHLIKANTGETVTVKNKNFRDLIRLCLQEGKISSTDMHMLWSCLTTR